MVEDDATSEILFIWIFWLFFNFIFVFVLTFIDSVVDQKSCTLSQLAKNIKIYDGEKNG